MELVKFTLEGSRGAALLLLDGSGWPMPCPNHSTAENEAQYPLYRRLGAPQHQSGRMRKTAPSPAFSGAVDPPHIGILTVSKQNP